MQHVCESLVMGQFLKFRNWESQFIKRNRFLYFIKPPKGMVWQAFRDGNWPNTSASLESRRERRLKKNSTFLARSRPPLCAL